MKTNKKVDNVDKYFNSFRMNKEKYSIEQIALKVFPVIVSECSNTMDAATQSYKYAKAFLSITSILNGNNPPSLVKEHCEQIRKMIEDCAFPQID